MISKAKVSLASVKAFEQAVSDAKVFSPKFDKGILCIEQLFNSITEAENVLGKKISAMQMTRERLSIKIKRLAEIIAKLTVQLSKLQEELSAFEKKLSKIEPAIIKINEEGEKCEIPNPAYIDLKTQISTLESQIGMLKEELYSYQQRLEKAKSVDGQLCSHVNAINSIIYSLGKKKNICRQFKEELMNIKKMNLEKSTVAVEKLKNIERIIGEYLRIKMIYEEKHISDRNSFLQIVGGINININNSETVNESVLNQKIEQNIIEREYNEEKTEELNNIGEKQQINSDVDRHVCEYAGRKYGGKYNTYEDCINMTPVNDPIKGRYTGDRGESKYIPSNRSAEGIKIIEILSQYGLDGIEYRNGEPIFEVCSEAVVLIEDMTEHRLSNFSQADIELARVWNLEGREGRKDWEAREVSEYRRANGLTWHEKCDTETMVLLKFEINAYFRHIGGCSECRLRDAHDDEEDGFDE